MISPRDRLDVSANPAAPSSAHLRGGTWVGCRGCRRLTVERGQTLESGLCLACRETPRDNWWARLCGHRNPPPPQRIRCETCGREFYGPPHIPGGCVLKCWRCLRQDAAPAPSAAREATAGLKDAAPRRAVRFLRDVSAFVRATCANHRSGQCRDRQLGPCLVLQGQPCKALEAVVGDARLVCEKVREGYPGDFFRVARAFGKGPTCNTCGAPVAKRRRLCDQCRDRRRRETAAARVRQHRLAGLSHVTN